MQLQQHKANNVFLCIQSFGLLSSGVDIKAANVEQEAESAVASVDT